jgi:hypothetical protein
MNFSVEMRRLQYKANDRYATVACGYSVCPAASRPRTSNTRSMSCSWQALSTQQPKQTANCGVTHADAHMLINRERWRHSPTCYTLNLGVCVLLRVLYQVQGFPTNATLFQFLFQEGFPSMNRLLFTYNPFVRDLVISSFKQNYIDRR